MLSDIFNILLPQTALGIFIVLMLILGMAVPVRFFKYARLIAIVGISSAILLLTTVQTEPQYFGMRNSLMSDSYTLLFDFVVLLCGFLVAILTRNIVYTIKRNAFTFYAIFLTGLFGAINVIASNDFLTLFVSMEILGFSTYFLIASSKGYHSKEASFKYLITSAVSSGIFLFGVSYLYGITGSINFSEIYEFISGNETSLMYLAVSTITVVGLISKLAIFPFANWIIDVYKGCESSILAFMSTIPKLAVFGILCRLLVFPLSGSFELTFILAILSLLTAFWANTYAIREKNVKIILACSASANASYALLAASLVSVYNLSTVIFYLICYSIMNIGAFAFINIYGDKNPMNVENFAGLFHRNRTLTSAYAIIILSLAGIPVMSGFIAKIYLFSAIAKSGWIFIPFLIILLLLTVVALFYYLKILQPLFNNDTKDITNSALKTVFSQTFVLISTAIITLLIGLCPERLIELCAFIAYNI